MTLNDFFYNRITNNSEFKQLSSLINKKNDLIKISGTFGSYLSLIIAMLFKKSDKSILFLCKSDQEAESFVSDFQSFGVDKAYFFPSDGTTPYHDVYVNVDISSQRLEVFKRLLRDEHCIIVSSVRAVLDSVIPKKAFKPYIMTLKVGECWEQEKLVKQLVECGYVRVDKVNLAGEFAVRGNIVDIYYSTFKYPIRIDFFDIEIDTIKSFNPYTQKSEENLNEVIIPPHKEFVFSDAEIARANRELAKMNCDKQMTQELLDNINSRLIFNGIQNYVNLFFDKSSIADYFENALLFVNDKASIDNSILKLIDEYQENYQITAYNIKPKITVEQRLFTLDEIYKKFDSVIEANNLRDAEHPFDIEFNATGLPVYLGNLDYFKEDLQKFIDDGYKIIIFAVNEIQTERLIEIFSYFHCVDDRFDFNEKGVSIVPLPLDFGFYLKNDKCIFINDYEIFGKKAKISKHFYKKRTEMIDSFIDLKPGDYVVEIHHGVGQFLGVERVKSMGTERDFIAIQYADNEKIYVAVEQLNFVQKYVSAGIGAPKLDKLGGKGWNKTKEKVRKSVEELARQLVELYSERQKIKGFKFSPDLPWQKEFEAKFPYDETEDQILTIEEVKRDMESDKIMDRLVCGDVGFGKTEVAIRAAFKAVMSGKQVAILVPTTILTEQHYENFKERMKDYPIKIEMLCRFRTAIEQEEIIGKLAKGEIDIIVGTHRLLSKDVTYKNLGLIIIDEEHRFGVKHKEILKQKRMTVDSLSMTATPIPRTLHMSLANIRDMSVINTPPSERTPVETYVMPFNEEILKSAVKKELDRKGQIFFVYNRVATILEMRKYLERICPEARIVISHAQMPEEMLEDIIHSFINYEYDILLTTTIVESGIDIPRANTIIIDRADRFGLAQLYQLRGRVGRSDIQAYAYLFYNKDENITDDAMKRLNVIAEYTDLGSGFKVAMKDLEIRGAGNIFGAEQSGNIMAVGFHLYCKLLNEAIAELRKDPNFKQEQIKVDKEVAVDLKYQGYIPNSYITDARQKIEFYKRIAAITREEELKQIRDVLTDRFGKIPSQVEELLFISEIRLVCKKYDINEITEKKSFIQIVFDDTNKININRLMNVIAKSDRRLYIQNNAPNSIFVKIYEFDEWTLAQKWEYIYDMLQKLFSK